MIMAELSSFKDIISLGLTSTSSLALAHHNVQRRYVKDIPRWRGDRIACIGDWMCQSDLLGLFTEEELAAFDGCQYPEYKDSEVDVCAIIYRSGAFKEARIHRRGTVFTEEYDKPVSKWKVLDELGINSMGCCVEIILIDHLVEPTLIYDVGMEWVLCNLSKKEYVYADDIAKAIDQSPHGPFFGNNLTFPEVLVPHICMEAGHSSPLRVEDKDDVRKGPWTGDRFDITTVDKVDLAEWRDVTDEVMDNINRIWELVWGENWKKKRLNDQLWRHYANVHYMICLFINNIFIHIGHCLGSRISVRSNRMVIYRCHTSHDANLKLYPSLET